MAIKDIMDLIMKAITIKVTFGPDADIEATDEEIGDVFQNAGFVYYGGGFQEDGYLIYMVTAGQEELTAENTLVLAMELIEIKGVLETQSSDVYDLRDFLNPTLKNITTEMNTQRPI